MERNAEDEVLLASVEYFRRLFEDLLSDSITKEFSNVDITVPLLRFQLPDPSSDFSKCLYFDLTQIKLSKFDFHYDDGILNKNIDIEETDQLKRVSNLFTIVMDVQKMHETLEDKPCFIDVQRIEIYVLEGKD
jgi:hypothetical protein